jgi:hypothetical protein
MQGHRTGWLARDIDLMVYIKATNNDSSAVGVDGYLLETKYPDGWKRLPRIDLDDPLSVEFLAQKGDNKQPLVWDFSNRAFDLVIQSSAIEPGHTVAGWAFFNWPSPKERAKEPYAMPMLRRDLPFRFSILDTKGEVTKVAAPFTGSFELLHRGGWEVMSEDYGLPWRK